MEFSDYAIVQNILESDKNDFTYVFTNYRKLVYGVARAFLNDSNRNPIFEIEDICQEAFLKIFKSLKQFNQEYRLSTWIATITKNLCIDKMNRQRNSFASIDTLNQNEEILKCDLTPEKLVIESESLKHVKAKIMELPDKYQLPILLFYFDGFSYSEISEMLNMSLPTLKNRLYRAKSILKRKLSVF